MRAIYSITICFALGMTAACNNATQEQQQQEKIKQVETEVKWVSVNDMTENSFSIEMPDGWKNAALLHRAQNSPRSLVTTISPDKNTVIYLGDPRLPLYSLPDPAMEASYRQFGMRAPYKFSNFIVAENYFDDYIQQRFGKLEGFKIKEKFQNKPILALQEKQRKKLNIDVNITNVSYRFEYKSNGKLIHGELNGATLSMGNIWLPEVSGFCTTGDPEKISAMMIKMMDTRVDNPQWRLDQDAKHRQTMAQIEQNTQRMTQQHQQNMANIQSSAAAHQQRMSNMQQSNDAWNKSWSENQASIDRQHERTINAIREEHTVMDKEGNTYKVDNKESKYFVDKQNNTYIGTHGTVSLDDLRAIKSLNIDNFEEVQIIR